MIQGQPETITFGLDDEGVTNTLIGILFMEKAHLIHAAAEKTVTSTVRQQAFPVKHEVPAKTDVPPHHVAGENTAVFTAPVLPPPPVLLLPSQGAPTRRE